MLQDYGLEENLEMVRRWYDGYQFGDAEVYNPWSVINYVQSCRTNKAAFAKPYWSNTSSNSIVRTLVELSLIHISSGYFPRATMHITWIPLIPNVALSCFLIC